MFIKKILSLKGGPIKKKVLRHRKINKKNNNNFYCRAHYFPRE